jgi:tRNA A37 threonylcarbamoyladenosine dehydratase
MPAQTQDRLKFQNNSPSFYNELYSRNWPIIDKNTQSAISKLNVTVAGCGSTGGAFIDGALRLGVSTLSFEIADCVFLSIMGQFLE